MKTPIVNDFTEPFGLSCSDVKLRGTADSTSPGTTPESLVRIDELARKKPDNPSDPVEVAALLVEVQAKLRMMVRSVRRHSFGEKRLQLRERSKRSWFRMTVFQNPYRLEEVAAGEGRPPFVLVVRGPMGDFASRPKRMEICEALHGAPEAERLRGCPILFLDNGVEFELWEIEREEKP